MSHYQSIGVASDRVMATLVWGLEIEFGRGAGEALAGRFLDAEECDFHWDARIEERWLGTYESLDEDQLELNRVAVLGRMEGRWFIAICIVDGDELPHAMMARRTFEDERQAKRALADAR